MYSVYKHTNKINGKVYIGITKQAVERRWQNGRGYAKTYFGSAIQKYGWDAFDHEVLFSGLTKNAACEMEMFLIIYYSSNEREHGYNICEGGQTGDNLIPKIGSNNPRSVSVKRIDPNTKEEVIYTTMQVAADSMGINRKGIGKACAGTLNTYKGYIWEYADKEYKKPFKYEIGKYPHTKQMKKVRMINVNGEEKIFESIKDATEYSGKSKAVVWRYIHGERKDPSGTRWELVT